jgi:ubiquitin C-terminal hydrolase
MFLFDAFHLGISRENKQFELKTENNIENNIENEYLKMMDDNFKNEYSELIDIFYGATYSEITNFENKKVLARRFQPFFILNLSIPNKINLTLEDCFETYLMPEELKDDNAWLNENTKMKEHVIKRDVIWKLPKIFIIHLKRWNYNGNKNQSNIAFELEYDFSKYLTTNTNTNTNLYELYSISNHHGGSKGGHYTTYVKNANNKWYNFNDTIVNEIKETEIISNKAYCLFYRKK